MQNTLLVQRQKTSMQFMSGEGEIVSSRKTEACTRIEQRKFHSRTNRIVPMKTRRYHSQQISFTVTPKKKGKLSFRFACMNNDTEIFS